MSGDPPRSRSATGEPGWHSLQAVRRESRTAGKLHGERTVVNRQRAVAVRPRALRSFLERASRLVFPGGAGVTVCLVSDREIERWNRRYRGKTGPTDVLSFPAMGDNGLGKRNGFLPDSAARFERGDIAISPAAARRNARALGRGLEQELRVLILHGLLHLAGYDHETDSGEMERRERRLRRRLGIAI